MMKEKEIPKDIGKPVVLIIDDDETMRETLNFMLKERSRVLGALSGEEGLDILRVNKVDVVFLDIKLPGMNGIEVLKEIKERFEDTDVIVNTVIKDVRTAVEAIRLGAYDYITKEFDYSEISALMERVMERRRARRELDYLHSEIEDRFENEFITGKSQRMIEIFDLGVKIAKLPVTVLITGESGSGKEILARFIHREGSRKDAPFVTVNIPSIPSELVESTLFGHEKGAFTGAIRQHIGKFEVADGGTIFLDEIGEMRSNMQSKLLRVLQESEIERVGGAKSIHVDIRVIAATNIDIEKAVKEGKFREDLYYRLNVVPIKLPRLAERKEDIEPLVTFFMKRYNRRFKKNISGIMKEALRILESYSWPGNIRELENLTERMIALSESDKEIKPEDIPIEYHLAGISFEPQQEEQDDKLSRACDTFERNFIFKALERNNWSRKGCASFLGVPLSTLKYKMDKLGIYEELEKKKEGRGIEQKA